MELYGGHMEFTQEGDSVNGGIDLIKIEVSDAGGGKFMRIITEGWSFDNLDELVELLNKARVAFEMDAK